MISLTFEAETWAHRLRAGPKLAVLAGSTVLLFSVSHWSGLLACLSVTLLLYGSCGAAFAAEGFRQLKGLGYVAAMLLLWHGVIGDLIGGVAISLRLVTALAAANFVTATTRLSDMIEVMRSCLGPLRSLGWKTGIFEMAVALAIRFVPVIRRDADMLAQAWKARSARSVGFQILIPLALITLDEADHVAEALRARGGAGV